MGLKFKLTEIDGKGIIDIDVEKTEGNKNICFLMETDEGVEYTFNVLDLEDILELGVFLNHKIGFDLIDIREVEKEIQKENEFNKTT